MFQIFFLSKELKLSCYFLLYTLAPCSLMAQVGLDSIHTDILQESHLQKQPRKFMAPAIMFGVGAIALKSHILKDLNHAVRYHVLESNPNIHNTLEDQLRLVPTASVFLLHTLGIKGKHNFVDKAIIYAIATTIADQSVSKLKTASKHLRPDGSNNRSFPSGHTATAFMAAEFLRKEYKDVSPWLTIAGYTAATATGALRVYHNKHWLTDVIAGAGLGILSTDIAYYVYPKLKRLVKKKKTDNTPISIAPAYVNNTLGISAVIHLN